MNRDQWDELLANAIGNELTDADKRRFDELMDSSADFREEYDSLMDTMNSLAALPAPGTLAGPTGPAHRPGWLAKAAIIGLAFISGYGVNAVTGNTAVDPTVSESIGHETRTVQNVVVAAYRQLPQQSALVRCMVAMADRPG